MRSKVWIWVALIATIILIISANYFIVSEFNLKSNHVQEPLKIIRWIMPFSLDYGNPDYKFPVIIYDEDKGGSWHIRDEDKWNRAINIGDRYSPNMSHPEDMWYTPDITVEGNNLSIDFIVWNTAGKDCESAILNMTSWTENLNETTGYPERDTVSFITKEVRIDNISAGKSDEVRIVTELLKPEKEEIRRLTIKMRAPYTFTGKNSTSCTYYSNHGRPPSGDVKFILKGKDAPELGSTPTIRGR
jgi:hypothetical protein